MVSLMSWIGTPLWQLVERDGGVAALVGVPVADACSLGHLAEVSLRSSPGRRPKVMESTNSASSRTFVSASWSRPSWARQRRQVVSFSSTLVCTTGAPSRGLVRHASSLVSVAAWVAS